MNLDELRTVQSKERRKDSLQQLRDSFYRDVATYIQDLKASRDRRATQVDDPFSDTEIRRLSDELETAEEVAEAVYERRVGKVVKLASFAAAEMPVDDEGMTGEERELFDDLVARIGQNKQTVLEVLSGTAEPDAPSEPVEASKPAPSTPAPPTDRASESTTQTDPAAAVGSTAETNPAESALSADSVLAEAMGTTPTEPQPEAAESATSPEVPPPEADPEPDAVLGTSTDGGTEVATPNENQPTDTPEPAATERREPPAESAPVDGVDSAGEDSDRTTVRITKNVGEIFCVDGREYTLCSEDVVTLPTANAEPLVERDAAQQLD